MSISAVPQSSDSNSDLSQPQAPVSPTTSNVSSHSASSAPPKRSNRRANTAERRATHNAVERARRETLNGRFLDLAALLPNLAAVRRPSKSAIVNSSIALIHAQRRHRAVAGRELRGLKAENDALRQELNEWRQRANLPRVEEPPRSSDLLALLSVEEEADMGEDERRAYEMRDRVYDDGDDLPEDGEDFGAEQYPSYTQPPQPVNVPAARISIPGHQAHLAAQQQAVYAQQQAAIARANQMQMAANSAQRQMPPQQVQPVQTPQAQLSFDPSIFASVDNFAEPKIDLYGPMFGSAPNQAIPTNWPQNNVSAPGSLLTPPGSGHGAKPSPFASTANQAFLGNYGQTGNLFNAPFMSGSISGSEDDNLSVGSSGHEGHYVGNSPDHSLGSSPVDHQFAFTAPAPAPYGQQRRLSVNIPAQAIGGAKQASPYPTNGAPFAAMGLMM